LVRLAQSERSGEAEAEICTRFLPRIRVFLARHLSGIFEVDDLAHEVVIGLLQAVRDERLREPQYIGAFALGICRNKVREVVRQKQRSDRAMGRIEPEPLPEAPAPRVEMGRLEECLHQLRERDRTVLRLVLVECRSAESTGAELQMSATNVRVCRHRAIDKLRRCLGVGSYEVQRR
jgi:RNA polymerase sigma factor (sigma-70 family)